MITRLHTPSDLDNVIHYPTKYYHHEQLTFDICQISRNKYNITIQIDNIENENGKESGYYYDRICVFEHNSVSIIDELPSIYEYVTNKINNNMFHYMDKTMLFYIKHVKKTIEDYNEFQVIRSFIPLPYCIVEYIIQDFICYIRY